MVAHRMLATALVTTGPSLAARAASAHPLHTTLTEISVDAARHTVRAVIRVFGDDIGAALSHRTGRRPIARVVADDSQAAAYVFSQFSFVDHASHVMPPRSCGVKRSGDLLWVCLEADLSGDPRGVSVRDAVLCEVFSDQVNIVQVAGGREATSILFTRGDGPKRLR